VHPRSQATSRSAIAARVSSVGYNRNLWLDFGVALHDHLLNAPPASAPRSRGGTAANAARARNRAREKPSTRHTLRIDTPGNVPITRRTSPAS
jgi:hypothetical protein